MKSSRKGVCVCLKIVAPHAGAWIEIFVLACGVRHAVKRVAPHAGAWIEISLANWSSCLFWRVAPHAGAWIEICWMERSKPCPAGRPPRGGVD